MGLIGGRLRLLYRNRARLAGPRVGAFWRLDEPGVDIIAGASLARRTVNLPLSVVKIRLSFWAREKRPDHLDWAHRPTMLVVPLA